MRVLQISPFSIPAEPISGGQIRIAAIADAYRAAGCHVDRCSILTRERDRTSELDIVMSWWGRHRRKHIGKPSNLGQIRQHWDALKSDYLARELVLRLRSSYQIIHVEHPWGYALINRLRHHNLLNNAKIIYGSHNIESELFRSVTQATGQWNRAAEKLATEIKEIELTAAAGSDITWAVSENDAQVLRSVAKRVIVAPNGSRQLPSQVNSSNFDALSGPFALFVGANYSPNIHGFLEMLGDDLDYLPKGTSIHTIGSCSEILKDYPPHKRWLSTSQLVHHGRVSVADLDAALLRSAVILLPIFTGGGSNLKTAEALASGTPILGTSYSFRGFQDWISSPEVKIENDPLNFQAQLASILQNARTQSFVRSPRPELWWTNVLGSAVTGSI